MKILVTNDDGIHCDGIRILAEELAKDHEVWIIAPDSDRSGSSHSVTLRSPGKIRTLDERTYTCSGMPADCVILAFRGAFPFRPEVVISGVNRGPNLGTDIVFSGTAAAARQGVLYGIPGIAVSLATYGPSFDFRPAARFVRSNLDVLLSAWDPSIFLNINVPKGSDADARGALYTVPSKRHYREALHKFEAPDGYTYCFLTGEAIENSGEDFADTSVIDSGRVSVTKVQVDPQVPRGFPAGKSFP